MGVLARGPLRFGTTVATNALLERERVRVALLIDEGLEDLIHLGDMRRPSLFDPDLRWPAPLVDRVVGVAVEIGPEGLVRPAQVDLDHLGDVDAVAIVLKHGPVAPQVERALAVRIREAWPGLHVACGHAIDAEVGLLPRIHTTLVDAAITPILHEALARDRLPTGALAMRSDGSLIAADALRAPDAVLSGPAGGVLAVEAIAKKAGFQAAVGLDMGGTSTDVCRVDVGRLPMREGHLEVAGVHLRRPMLEVHTIAAGGGSILDHDGRQLRVGPASAGADPGPQCYGRGGPPTLTDAALKLGLVDPESFDPPLDPGAVRLPGEAEAFVDIAREAMAEAVRTLAVQRGVDLRDHALVTYGGAAGAHACEVAARLGIRTVLVHPFASVLSAFGQSLARREEEALRAIWRPLEACASELDAIAQHLLAELADLGEVEVRVGLRVEGTDHPLEVELEGDLAEAFQRAHRERYGFDREHAALEVTHVRARTRAPAPDLPRIDVSPWGFEGCVEGPRTLFTPTTAVHIPGGWQATVGDGLLTLQHLRTRPRDDDAARTPHGVALWSHRFMAVATQAGETLRRLARSVNIRERLDFSCALFDEAGQLVANAPHIPVHLGAMGETVRDVIAHEPFEAGQAWLTNDPGAGGSHLPDLTVVTAVEHGGRRFWVASRGHHVDVGGTTPGSMPPDSTQLSHEGIVFRRLPLISSGRLRPDLEAHLLGCRHPDVVRADLEAQIAANAHAARLLCGLGAPDHLAAWMAHLQDVAAEAVAEVIDRLADGDAEDTIDGVLTRVEVRPGEGRLSLRFEAAGVHDGNLNAPVAVVRAAVLYALRVLVDHPIPLNEGALRAIDLHLPSPSLLSPPPGAAIAGGNVETSQRVVDLVLRAVGRRASGQGTMNNLTLGGEGWAFYETLGGGAGATPDGPGQDARQVHMTNTRATDAEVLERRLPLRLRRFAVRAGSGGSGLHRGGDGVIREIEVVEPATAALLVAWRPEGAHGLAGGGRGAPGRATILRADGGEEAWDGRATPLAPGDRVRVETPGGGGFSPKPPPV